MPLLQSTCEQEQGTSLQTCSRSSAQQPYAKGLSRLLGRPRRKQRARAHSQHCWDLVTSSAFPGTAGFQRKAAKHHSWQSGNRAHQVRGQNKNSQEASHIAPWSCSSVQPQGTQQGALGISPCPTSSLNKNSKASSHFPSCTDHTQDHLRGITPCPEPHFSLNSPENRPCLRVTEGIPTPHNYANAAKHIRATGLPQGQLCCWSPPCSSCLWFPICH